MVLSIWHNHFFYFSQDLVGFRFFYLNNFLGLVGLEGVFWFVFYGLL